MSHICTYAAHVHAWDSTYPSMSSTANDGQPFNICQSWRVHGGFGMPSDFIGVRMSDRAGQYEDHTVGLAPVKVLRCRRCIHIHNAITCIDRSIDINR